MRVTHAHPLNPAALAFVPFGIVLVRVRVRSRPEFLHKHALTGFTIHAYSFKRLALPRLPDTSPFSPDLMRITHAHPLNPAAMAFVPFGIVLVRVRVRVQTQITDH